MTCSHETGLLRGMLAVALLLGTAGASHAQAPGSAFGQSPQQLQLHLERPAAPALAAPNRGGLGLQKVPTFAAPNPKPKPAAPLNPSISPASVLKAIPDVRNLKTQ